MSISKPNNNLSQEQQNLLKLIIDFFIEFNDPVSSKTIKEFYKLDTSTATIRNRMLELEELNYINKSSKTSGRVPTDLGYHYYASYLRKEDQSQVVKSLINHLKTVIDNRTLTIEEVITKSCKLISESINITSIYATEESDPNKILNHIDFFVLKDRQTVMIIVTDGGGIYTKNFLIDKTIHLKDLKLCISIINEKLKGIKISEIDRYLLSLKPIFLEKIMDFERLFETCLSKIFKISFFRDYVCGIENLIAPNQFQEVENLKRLIKILEDHSIWEILKNKLDKPTENNNEGIKLLIGKDLDHQLFDDNLSLISTTLTTSNNSNNDLKKGKLMLIAPKRINYSNVFYILTWLKNYLKNR